MAEAVGTALLLAVVVGSGIMAQGLFPDSVGSRAASPARLQPAPRFRRADPTFGGISGAHFNPVVTIFDAASGGRPWREVAPYVAAQTIGAIVGVLATHAMFDIQVLEVSQHVRSGVPLMFSEFVATFGLIAVIWGVAKKHPTAVPYAVGGYITAAYWSTPTASRSPIPPSRFGAR